MQRIFRILLCVSLVYAGATSAESAAGEAAGSVDRFRRGDSELRIDFDSTWFRVIEGKRHALPESERNKRETLSLGAKGEDVSHLQMLLGRAGHFQGQPDGEFDATTQAAVIAFQKEQGLAADGRVGTATRKALKLPKEIEWKRAGTPIATERGARMRYNVGDGLELESAVGAAGATGPWTRIAYSETAKQIRGAWPHFVHDLVDQGLMCLESSRDDQTASMELTFAASESSTPLGPQRLNLSREALQFLKAPAKYPARLPKGSEWIILVHEPHWDLGGHLQLVAGLRELAWANPQLAFEFLVEGDRPDRCPSPTVACDIPVEQFAQLFSEDKIVRHQQVQYLLRNYLIDSPLAYRLLYDPVPSLAIDDQTALDASPRSDVNHTAATQAMQGLRTSLLKERPQSAAQRKKVLTVVASFGELAAQLMLEAQSGGNLVKQFDALITANRKLANDARALDATRYGSYATALEKYADELSVEVQVIAQIDARDQTMVKNILAGFQRPGVKRTPVVFIGSAHTPGMIDLLPAHYGYVVLEPRVSDYSVDRSAFNVALHKYPTAITTAATKLRKLLVLPQEEFWPQLDNLLERVAARVSSRPALDGAGFDPHSISAIREAIDANANFNLATVSVASGGQQPPLPPGFDGAFASFSPRSEGAGSGGNGSGGHLQLLAGKRRTWDDAAREDWRKPDRLAYLQNVMFFPARAQGSNLDGRKVTFFRDPNTKRTFISVHVAHSNTYYLFESERGLDGLAMLIDPTSDLTTAHLRVGELLRKLQADRS